MKLKIIVALTESLFPHQAQGSEYAEIYGTGEYDEDDNEILQEIEPGSKATSDIVWRAFHELDLREWFIGIDPEVVYSKVREIIARHNLDPGYAEDYAKKNYESFRELFASGVVNKWGDPIDENGKKLGAY